MKKTSLLLALFTIIPAKAFCQDLTAADCLVLEAKMDRPQIPNQVHLANQLVSPNTSYRYPSNETLEQKLERKKAEVQEAEQERKEQIEQFVQEDQIQEKINEQINTYVDELKVIFDKNSCQSKIETINDKMGCLAFKLTLDKLWERNHAVGYANSSSPNLQGYARSNKPNETPIEKEIRELDMKIKKIHQQTAMDLENHLRKSQAIQDAKDQKVQKRLKSLGNIGKINCKEKLKSFPDLIIEE